MKKFLIKKTRFVLTIVILLVLLTSTVLADTDDHSLANSHEHSLSEMTILFYTDKGSEGHIAGYRIYEYCHYCDYKVFIDTFSTTLPHDLSTSNYHSGTLHFINESCDKCPYNYSYSYKCPGNPCIIPASVDYSNEEIDYLIKFEDELNFINAFSIEKHDNCLNEEIHSSIKLEGEIDFINTFFIEENNTYLNEKNNSFKAASCTNHYLTRIKATNFDDNGPNGHTYTYIEYDKCFNCGYKTDYTTIGPTFEPHKITTSNYHSGTLHFINESCYECPYDYTYSYKCPGNPCIIPASINSEN